MNRLDVYTAVHKMHRARLFRLTVEAGQADPADTVTMTRLAAAVDALAAELAAHAEHEERFIHPLLRQNVPLLTARLDAAHVSLDTRLDHLRQVAVAATAPAGPAADPNALYRALAAFTAAYLEHLAVEEGEALPALWDGCTDEELLGILASFRGSRSDAENLTSLLAELATLNPPEIERMISAGLGPVPLSDVSEILATVLDPRQLGALRHATAALTARA
jgi:Hemerythrin HHE cation binding domain